MGAIKLDVDAGGNTSHVRFLSPWLQIIGLWSQVPEFESWLHKALGTP